jgi:hypothetical protein
MNYFKKFFCSSTPNINNCNGHIENDLLFKLNYKASLVEFNSNSNITNVILVNLYPRTPSETELFKSFLFSFINDKNPIIGKKKIIINIYNTNYSFYTYNYNILGKVRHYIENLENIYINNINNTI